MKLKVNSPGVVLGGQICRPGQEIMLDDKYLGQLVRLKNSLDLDIEILENPSGPMTLNYKADNPDNRDFKLSTDVNLQIPTVVDYSPEMSPVKDQGRLGSCVGFAVAAVKEWQERKEHLQEKSEGKIYDRLVDHDYSEQWIYYKSKEIDPWPGEEGTSLRYAMKILQKQGVPPEKGWAYNDTSVGKAESWAPLIARWGYGGNYYRIGTPAELEVALSQNGPVGIGILCFEEIFNVNRTGIVAMPKNDWLYYGGHAVACVGYNRQTQLFKFKNSWGKGWGQNGYGYLPYAYIAKYMMDAWVLTDINVTKEIFLNGPNQPVSAVEGNVQKEETHQCSGCFAGCNTVQSKEEEIVIGINCCNQPDECIVDGCDCDCHAIEITEAVEEFADTPEGKKSFFKKLFRN